MSYKPPPQRLKDTPRGIRRKHLIYGACAVMVVLLYAAGCYSSYLQWRA